MNNGTRQLDEIIVNMDESNEQYEDYLVPEPVLKVTRSSKKKLSQNNL